MSRRGRRRHGPALVEPRRQPAPAVAPQRATLDAFVYSPAGAEETRDLTTARACALAGRDEVAWINLAGADDAATVAALGVAFGLHPLVVEAIGQEQGRPKLVHYEGYVFVVAPMVSLRPAPSPAEAPTSDLAGRAGHAGWEVEQISFVLGDGFLLSFQPDATDVFGPVRDRLRTGAGRLGSRGADYLLYALLDLIVDELFVVLEHLGDAIETLEDAAVRAPVPGIQPRIARFRRDVALLRRSVWPLREVLAALQRDDVEAVADATRPFLRDLYDHLVQAVDVLESLRDVLAALLDLYLSAVSTRQNEVMKVLTVVGTIFLPLTFLTGLYGMNFDVMPELHWRYGYVVLLGVMVLITAGTLAYFRKRRLL